MGNEPENHIDGDENWTKVADNTVRRRLQNRLAQRRYRRYLFSYPYPLGKIACLMMIRPESQSSSSSGTARDGDPKPKSKAIPSNFIDLNDGMVNNWQATQRNRSHNFGGTRTSCTGHPGRGADKQVNHQLGSDRVATNDGEDGRHDGEAPRETITVLNVHGSHGARLGNGIVGTQQTLEPRSVNQLSSNATRVDQSEDNDPTLLIQTSMEGSPSFSMSSVDYTLQPGDLSSSFHGELPNFWDDVDMHVNTTPLPLPPEPVALIGSSNQQTSVSTPSTESFYAYG